MSNCNSHPCPLDGMCVKLCALMASWSLALASAKYHGSSVSEVSLKSPKTVDKRGEKEELMQERMRDQQVAA